VSDRIYKTVEVTGSSTSSIDDAIRTAAQGEPVAAQPRVMPESLVSPGRSHRSDKPQRIIATATDRFARDGYDNTRWADVAADVGVGPTALYHYFHSKQHCLFVILEQAVEDFRLRLTDLTAAHPDPTEALVAALCDCFDLSESDVRRNRLLVSEMRLLSSRRSSPTEERARQAARARIRDLEFAWATLLSAVMRQQALPRQDARDLTRAILGLYSSIWCWYPYEQATPLATVADFFVGSALRMIGVPPELYSPPATSPLARESDAPVRQRPR